MLWGGTLRAPMTKQPALKVTDLSVSYGTVKALQDATFSLTKGTATGVLGPNGSGKTSLLKGVLSLVRRTSGTVSFEGRPLSDVRREVAYVPQHKEVDWDFPITAAQMVLLGTYPSLGPVKRAGEKEKQWAHACLDRLGMALVAKRQVSELSGGQQQRLFLARALAQRPTYLFLDEPLVGVDAASEQTILGVLQEMTAQGVTVLMVDHDLVRAQAFFDQVLLVDHRIVTQGQPSQVLTPELISQVYLGSALPSKDERLAQGGA